MTNICTYANIAGAAYDRERRQVGAFRRVAVPKASVYCAGDQFYGSAWTSGHTGVIAFRGSDEAIDWIHDDRQIAAGVARDTLSGAAKGASTGGPIGALAGAMRALAIPQKRSPGFLPDQLGNAFGYCAEARRVLLNTPGCRRLAVVGHSLGGALAALVASRITTAPMIGVTFNAPGCAHFERVGAPVDDDERDAADALHFIAQKWATRPLATIGAAEALVVSGAQFAAKSALDSMVVKGRAKLALPSSNANYVWNIESTSPIGAGDPASGLVGGFIGRNPIRVPVKIVAGAAGGFHTIKPLINALEEDPRGQLAPHWNPRWGVG